MAYDPKPFMDRAKASAEGGTAEYKRFFLALDNYHKNMLVNEGHHADYKKTAEKADEK